MSIKVREGGAWVEVSSGGGSSDPVGTIVGWASSTAPTGWLECNGQSTSGYTALAALIGSNVPDLRGEFVRGWDNSAGVDAGRALLSTQADEFESHNHTINSYTGGGGPLGGHDGSAYNGSITTSSQGGTETRPRNVALMYIIKHTATSGGGGGVTSTWTLGANGSSHYTFTGPGGLSNTDDPKIYLARGQTYEFVNNSGGSHPFQIQQSNGSAYNTGVSNNAASSGTIRFEVPFSTPNILQYKCTSHSSMGNTIIIYPDLSP
jgi:hypothetical protein